MEFDWNPTKAEQNLRKHGVSFTEAATIFADPLELLIYDPDHFGMSASGRLLVVGYTERGSTIRLIFARRATMPERIDYDEA